MTPIVYNASLAVGVLLAAIGAGWQWGIPIGLMVAAALILGLTVYGSWLVARTPNQPKG